MSNHVSQQRTLLAWNINEKLSLTKTHEEWVPTELQHQASILQMHLLQDSKTITNIAINNCHLQLIYVLKMLIFHSYVSLPEGNYLQVSAASLRPCHSLGCHTPKSDHDSRASLLKGDLVLGFHMVLHCFPCTQLRNHRFRDSDHKGPTGLTWKKTCQEFTLVWFFQSDQALYCLQLFSDIWLSPKLGRPQNTGFRGTLVSIKSFSKIVPPACRSNQGGRPSPVDDILP